MTEVIKALSRHTDLPSSQRVHDCLTALHPIDQGKIRGLIAALADSDPNLRLMAVEILAELDPIDASLPALITALEDPDRIVRIAAVEPVVRFREKACVAIPILESWLTDEREYVRIAAARAIGMIDANKIPEITPVLLDGLKSETSIDRANAAFAIGDLGEADSEALPLLEELLKDECAAPRCEAASAIAKITGNLTVEISVGVDLLHAAEWIDRYVGAEHLGCLGAVVEPALPYLRRALNDDGGGGRY